MKEKEREITNEKRKRKAERKKERKKQTNKNNDRNNQTQKHNEKKKTWNLKGGYATTRTKSKGGEIRHATTRKYNIFLHRPVKTNAN